MRKSFPLAVEGLKPPRVVEAIKHDVRKYLKRERKKKLPEGVDFWDFDCRVGGDEASAEVAHEKELTAGIDRASQEAWPSVYIEILAKPGHRKKKERGEGKGDSSSPEIREEG